MKLLIAFTLGIFFLSFNASAQEKIKDLVKQGTTLNDEGKYEEAIEKYKAALEIDKNSTLANYELSYTCMMSARYADAVQYSKKVIDQNTDNQHEAYAVLGSSFDMLGKPEEAIKAYEEGLTKFPNSYLLNYNLALTAYKQNEMEKAQQAAINAIIAKPKHGSSHLILSAIMKSKGNRVRALLPLYYFLMMEPNSKRSHQNYNSLKEMLSQGIEKKDDENVEINVPSSATTDSVFGAAEMMVSVLGASEYTEENKGRSENELFVETNKNFFSMLGELKKENKGFWWDLYVTTFYDLVQTKNDEAYSYYILQSTNSIEVNNWIANNSGKMQSFKDWMKK